MRVVVPGPMVMLMTVGMAVMRMGVRVHPTCILTLTLFRQAGPVAIVGRLTTRCCESVDLLPGRCHYQIKVLVDRECASHGAAYRRAER